MADVRLTATNPADSTVVPVACNEKGELKLEEPIVTPPFDGNLNGNLNVQGEANFTYTVTRSGRNNIASFISRQNDTNTFGVHYVAYNADSEDPCFVINPNGGAIFKGNVQIGGDPGTGAGRQAGLFVDTNGVFILARSGNDLYAGHTFIIREEGGQDGIQLRSNGDAWFRGGVVVEGNRPILLALEPDNDANYSEDDDRAYTGPYLDVKNEILLIKAALQAVMDRLKMTPPSDWEVWDGSSANS